MKRLPKKESGALKVQWLKRHGEADFWAVWGDGVAQASARVAITALSDLCKELVERGFDISTLKFEIRKPAPPVKESMTVKKL